MNSDEDDDDDKENDKPRAGAAAGGNKGSILIRNFVWSTILFSLVALLYVKCVLKNRDYYTLKILQ